MTFTRFMTAALAAVAANAADPVYTGTYTATLKIAATSTLCDSLTAATGSVEADSTCEMAWVDAHICKAIGDAYTTGTDKIFADCSAASDDTQGSFAISAQEFDGTDFSATITLVLKDGTLMGAGAKASAAKTALDAMVKGVTATGATAAGNADFMTALTTAISGDAANVGLTAGNTSTKLLVPTGEGSGAANGTVTVNLSGDSSNFALGGWQSHYAKVASTMKASISFTSTTCDTQATIGTDACHDDRHDVAVAICKGMFHANGGNLDGEANNAYDTTWSVTACEGTDDASKNLEATVKVDSATIAAARRLEEDFLASEEKRRLAAKVTTVNWSHTAYYTSAKDASDAATKLDTDITAAQKVAGLNNEVATASNSKIAAGSDITEWGTPSVSSGETAEKAAFRVAGIASTVLFLVMANL